MTLPTGKVVEFSQSKVQNQHGMSEFCVLHLIYRVTMDPIRTKRRTTTTSACCTSLFCKTRSKYSHTTHVIFIFLRSYKDGQTPIPKLIFTASSPPSAEPEKSDYKKYVKGLKETLISSKQMVSGPSCPVWVFDSPSSSLSSSSSSSSSSPSEENCMFDERYPNYLLVKFLSRDVMEQELVKYKDSVKFRDSEQYTDIRDQVCVSSCIFVLFCSNILQLSLFDNNPHAAGEEREYVVGAEKGFFRDFHVGIVTTNKKRHRKSDKLRALLSYISRHVQVLSCSFCFTIDYIIYNILSCGSVLLICFASVLGYIQCSMATFPVISPMLWCICAGFIRRRFHAAIHVFESVFQWRFFGCAQI